MEDEVYEKSDVKMHEKGVYGDLLGGVYILLWENTTCLRTVASSCPP